eukprot:TRINITY_DN23048_c0_g1_i3.p1 TRINITY_DN23048_c0_g1~~TRINITY_DN23048_c0_g1_i3.p1  ORF type:complete len:137 (+),score=7.13 TRINITY_DN23048_c0_g1_i3:74-484(+)
MCFNACGFGALHMFILMSAPWCILTAVAGQLYGCTPTMRSSGYGSDYVCSDVVEVMYFFNNGWQVTVWLILTIVALTKPPKHVMAATFSPFILFAISLLAYTALRPSEATADMLSPDGPWCIVVSTVVWFGMFACA